MKKLLLILLCLPMIGFGQACQYGSSTDASEICDFYQNKSFATYRNADIALDKILDVTGMSKRFVLKECNDISNCLATTYKGIRYILYDRDFMDAIATRTNSWSSTSILAHEIGHHVNGHTLGKKETTLSESRQMEIEADEYSGFVMFKLGASLSQAQEAIRVYGSDKDDSYSTHPSKDKRLRAIVKGYNKAKGQGSNNSEVQSSNNDYSTNSSTLTADDYFYKAYNNESDWQYQIDNYTKCLRIDPDFVSAYVNRGVAHCELSNYSQGISDFNSSIKTDPTYANAYFCKGLTYFNLGNYEDAIADLTRGIKIDPTYPHPYSTRGLAYAHLKDLSSAMTDFNSAVRINPDEAEYYENRGYTYLNLGNHEDAIADFTIAIRINPNSAKAFSYRAEAKHALGMPYCRDIKIACDLSQSSSGTSCENYNNFCK
jgi:tetratricopeptide (TPR) repeat protein